MNHAMTSSNSEKDQEVTLVMMMTKIGYNQFPLFVGTEMDSKSQGCCCHRIIRLRALVSRISHGEGDDAFLKEQSISFEIMKFQTNYKRGQAEN